MTDESTENKNPFEKLDSIGAKMRDEYKTAADERRPYELRWLMNLRMYQGIYEPDLLARLDKNQTKAYIRLGRIKVNTMDARMFDMLFPGGVEHNWSISATPKPKVPEDVYAAIATQISQASEIEVEQVPVEEIEKAAKDWADDKAVKMSEEIADKLTEGKYRRKGRKVIHAGNLFGTGWLKGTLTEVSSDIAWEYNADTDDYEAVPFDEENPSFEFVPVWDVYPDLSAQSSDLSLCDYIYQRHVMGKHHLQKLAKRDDFDGQAIRDYIKNHKDGNAVRAFHEEELRSIGSEKQSTNTLRNKYEVLERWGYVSGEWLADCGCEDLTEEQLEDDLFGVVWLLGDRVIKAALHPSERAKHIFHKYHFEEDETSVLGFGVPDAIRDTTNLANSSMRATVDNAAITAGPQVEVNLDLIDAAGVADANNIYPFKTWLRRGKGDDARHKAIHVTNIDSHVNELVSLFNTFKALTDEVSNIPSYMQGEAKGGGAADTSSGLSMLMGAANITIKDVVANFDEGITVPFITSIYDWTMMFGPKSVKGDVAIKATGSSSLVAREVRAKSLGQFQMDTANPADSLYVNRSILLRERAKTLELPDNVLHSEEKSDQIMAQVQAQAAQLLAEMMAQEAMRQQQEEQMRLEQQQGMVTA